VSRRGKFLETGSRIEVSRGREEGGENVESSEFFRDDEKVSRNA
jgi:hypothetical protein